jgi:hypothetical protein
MSSGGTRDLQDFRSTLDIQGRRLEKEWLKRGQEYEGKRKRES